jgi:putative transposase
MPRLPRYILPGVPQHIIQRGNNRQAIFAAEGDYIAYLDWLKRAADQYGLYIHAYVLMTNHVHLLATPMAEDSIGKTLQSLGRRYVQYFNFSYGRTGTLWESRYRATVVDAESYFLACSRYIELNPVRAAMVQAPGDYRWSSYRCNGMGKEDGLVAGHDMYRRLGLSTEQRQSAYRALFQHAVADELLTTIRDATNKGWALGNDRFRIQIEAMTARRAAPLPRGRPKKIDSAP